MRPINIYQLSRVKDLTVFPLFEKQLSCREVQLKPKGRELSSLNHLVELLFSATANISSVLSICNFFYYSFSIPKIAKEFDLLRIGDNYIVNIELKSSASEETIKNQLIQNRYYLSSLRKPMKLIAFSSDAGVLYELNDSSELTKSTAQSLYALLYNQGNCYTGAIEKLFCASNYLISPMNTPERFLKQEYFLTSHQQKIRNEIIQNCICGGLRFFGITGLPGTGKTLLLYDLAVALSKLGKCCVIHCGILPDGLKVIDERIDSLDIMEAKLISSAFDFSPYRYVLIDECHRFHKKQFDMLLQKVNESNITVSFSFDEKQVLSHKEHNADIAGQIRSIPDCKIYSLTNKIRTNKELASFIERLRDLHSPNKVSKYPSVNLSYASDSTEAFLQLQNYVNLGYTFINYTGSSYNSSEFDSFNSLCKERNTHTVIGQEFDNVVMLLNSAFAYDENGRLRAKYHPNPDYLYRQLLFQGLSRVREKLAIVILDNPDVFKKALKIITNA